MYTYENKRWWKVFFFAVAILIGAFSLWYTNSLVSILQQEEDKKIKLWANATRLLIKGEGDINFLLDIAKDNTTIPLILVDDRNNIISTKNLPDTAQIIDTSYILQQLEIMKNQHEPIKILYDEANMRYNYLYYKNSFILSQLKSYPIIQLALIAFFALLSYFTLSASRRAEQNQVWVGMSKETAHQLGTPISSLKEWINLLRDTEKENQDELLMELDNDVKRLELITERFSKIGSDPVLKTENLDVVLQSSLQYLNARTSSHVDLTLSIIKPGNWANINIPLFDWVIENLCKNAIDAMSGKGTLIVQLNHDDKHVYIDISDTGKGIPKSKFKTVFKPGYTTKKRGWGLGLSLVKRIVESYQKGTIYVRHSEIGKGTTFRIVLQAK